MKPFAAQSYYELLEISVSASTADIRAAWDRLNRMYADDQLALYGLANAGTAAALRKRLREAMEVLTDDELRGMYDEEIGLPARELPIEEPVTSQLEMGELLRGADHSVASTHPKIAFSWAQSPMPLASPSMPPVVIPRDAPRPAPLVPLPAEVVAPAPVILAPVVASPVVVAPPSAAEAERLSEEAALSMLPRPSPSPRPSTPPAPSAPRLPDIPPDAEYNGELLRKVRTALGLSLAVVAEHTRIGSKHLENVEADRYDALPATVYLRGILMSLAKELRLDGLKVSRSYLSLVERIRSKG